MVAVVAVPPGGALMGVIGAFAAILATATLRLLLRGATFRRLDAS